MAKHKKVSKSRRYPVQNRNPKANRQYKDTIFRMLFKDKQHLLSLYDEKPGGGSAHEHFRI